MTAAANQEAEISGPTDNDNDFKDVIDETPV